jgi:cell division control protein 7
MTAIFSQHSSNPLDVGSEDAQNSAYLARVHGHGPGASSEDVIPERGVRNYQAHIAIMFPGHAALQGSPHPDTLVDLDDDDDMAEPTLDTDAELGVDDADAAGSAADDADEEHTLRLRPPDEQAAVRHEISELERAVPQLDGDYRIVDRLGTGTFSSVYKAVDLGGADRWDNRPWAAHADPSPTAAHGGKAFVAVKRIYVTSNPERMRNEIAILEDVRGCRHVSQLITAFRCEDQVVVVMPYHRNVDFRVRTSSLIPTSAYLRGLI